MSDPHLRGGLGSCKSHTARTRSFAVSLLVLAASGSLWAVTYSTSPSATTAGTTTLSTLTINRTISGDEEGFSSDEMNTFSWTGRWPGR
jgi:hypothetical protein